MKIGGIVENIGLTLYRINSLLDEPGSAGNALWDLAQLGINLEYIIESGFQDGRAILAFCVKKEDNKKVDDYVNMLSLKNKVAGFIKTENVSVLGIYGPHFREKHSIAANFFNVLGKSSINILGISSSISSICCVIEEANLGSARAAILDNYQLP